MNQLKMHLRWTSICSALAKMGWHVQKAIHIPMWRWAFFLGWAIPMYRITRVAMYLLLAALEFRYLISRRFIYYTIGIKVCLMHKVALQHEGSVIALPGGGELIHVHCNDEHQAVLCLLHERNLSCIYEKVPAS